MTASSDASGAPLEGAEVEPLARLILVRLLALPPGKERLGAGAVAQDIRAAAGAPADPDLAQRFARALGALVGGGDVERSARGALSLTGSGRAAALAFLGLEALPRGATWRSLRDRVLMGRLLRAGARAPAPAARAAALPGPADAEALKAEILGRAYGLDLPAGAGAGAGGRARGLGRTRNAIVWRRLGIDSDRPVTANAILEALFLAEVAPAARLRAPRRAAERLAAALVGAPTARPADLRREIVRRFAAGHDPVPSAGEAAARARRAAAPAPLSLDDLAARARAIAAAVPAERRFGPSKVFIRDVVEALAPALAERDLDSDGLKRLLAEAHHRGLIDLSRADLVEAMDPEAVRASETRYLNATFHFIRAEPAPPAGPAPQTAAGGGVPARAGEGGRP